MPTLPLWLEPVERLLEAGGAVLVVLALVAVVVLAREAGLNRYEKIVDFDFSPAKAYWASTQRFWDAINARWRQILGDNKGYRLEKYQGQSFLMSVLLEADRVSRADVADEEIEQFVDQLFQRFVKVEG